jgi:hypothetical protein
MGRISDCLHLRKIDLFVNSTTHRRPNKTIYSILIKDFFCLPPVSTTSVVHLELPISLQIFELRNGPNEILRSLGRN